jgi:starch-binding outer membrane protein, SusD/RagB family
MKTIKNILTVLLLPFMFSACSDYLDVKDESAINPAIWDNENSAKLYINNIYNLCLPGFGGESPVADGSMAAISDETDGMGSKLLLGTLEEGSAGAFSAATYQAIRYINIAFDAMKTSEMSLEAKRKTLGQLYFFRAYQHWKLVNIYGGVPYMREVVDYLSDDIIKNAPRHKTSECIAFLKADLDSAITHLPATWPSDEYARITRAGAAAMKGRIMLFWASPQFNPTNDINRWKEAYETNLAARDICLADGYALMTDITVPVTPQWPVAVDFNKIFITKRSGGNREAIIVTPYLQSQRFHGYENSVRPSEITNNTGRPSNLPSWDLVAAFPMKDGTLAYSNTAQATNRLTNFTGSTDIRRYYQNRDPRFYATIAFNGSYYPLEGNAQRRQWTYTGGEAVTSDRTSTTGFYTRKYVDPAITGADMARTHTDWIELRYAEVLLNLAEAAFEFQGSESAVGYDCLKQIRQRAGIEPGNDGMYGLKSSPGYSITEIVMNERRVELAFEGKRFWDLRRRNMFTRDLGTKILKLNVWKKSGSGYTFALSGITPTNFNAIRNDLPVDSVYKYFTMTLKSTGPLVRGIAYKTYHTPEELTDKIDRSYNFFDIPQNILTRSPALVQTMGWPNGVFNPFE